MQKKCSKHPFIRSRWKKTTCIQTTSMYQDCGFFLYYSHHFISVVVFTPRSLRCCSSHAVFSLSVSKVHEHDSLALAAYWGALICIYMCAIWGITRNLASAFALQIAERKPWMSCAIETKRTRIKFKYQLHSRYCCEALKPHSKLVTTVTSRE